MHRDGQTGTGGCDVLIIGGGIVGTCISWFLARDGVDVLCLDYGAASGSVANAGSLHVQMQSRLMRQFPERLDDYGRALPMYPRAVDFWQEVAGELDDDVELRMDGGLMIADRPEQLAALEQKTAIEREKGVATEMLDRTDLLRIAPYLGHDVCGASYCAIEGKVNPLLANAALRRMARRSGARFIRSCKASRIESTAGGFRVESSSGEIQAERVAIAAGAGSGDIAATIDIHVPMTAEALHMNITEAAEPIMHGLLQHAERPITLKQLSNGQVVIGGGWPATTGDADVAPGVLRDSLLGNLALANKIVPSLGSLSIVRCWAGINPLADLLSVLGESASLSGIYFAIPGDAGYTLGPYCSRLIADQILGRQTEIELASFSPDRFAANAAVN